MYNILIVTHGNLSDGLRDAVDTIVGTTEGIDTLKLVSGMSVETLGEEILTRLKDSIEINDVVIFTDLISASPYNQALLAINQLKQSEQAKVHIIGGVNLAMVLEAVNQRLLGVSAKESVPTIISQGKNAIDSWNISVIDDSDDDF